MRVSERRHTLGKPGKERKRRQNCSYMCTRLAPYVPFPHTNSEMLLEAAITVESSTSKTKINIFCFCNHYVV